MAKSDDRANKNEPNDGGCTDPEEPTAHQLSNEYVISGRGEEWIKAKYPVDLAGAQ